MGATCLHAAGQHQTQLSVRSASRLQRKHCDARRACSRSALPVLLPLMLDTSVSNSSGPAMPDRAAVATHCVSSSAAAGACAFVLLPHRRCKIRFLLSAKAFCDTLAHSRPKACKPSNKWTWAERLAYQYAMPANSMSPFACTGLALRRVGQGVEMCPVCRYRPELPLICSLQGQRGLPVKGLSPTLDTSMAAGSEPTALLRICDLNEPLGRSEQAANSAGSLRPAI